MEITQRRDADKRKTRFIVEVPDSDIINVKLDDFDRALIFGKATDCADILQSLQHLAFRLRDLQ